MYILDIVLVVVLLFSIFMGIKKGFFLTLFELVSSLLAFFAAKAASARIAPSLYDQYASSSVESYVRNALEGVSGVDYSASLSESIESIPSTFSGLMSTIAGIDTATLSQTVADANLTGEEFILWVIETLAPIVTAVISGICFVVLAIVFIILFKILAKIADKIIKKLPIIKQANKSLGAVAGALRGCILVAIFAMVLALVAGFIANDSFVTLVDQSIIINTIREFVTSFTAV
ncbi:MAG: CvpA family protein [Clostridia bacterium]